MSELSFDERIEADGGVPVGRWLDYECLDVAQQAREAGEVDFETTGRVSHMAVSGAEYEISIAESESEVLDDILRQALGDE